MARIALGCSRSESEISATVRPDRARSSTAPRQANQSGGTHSFQAGVNHIFGQLWFAFRAAPAAVRAARRWL